MAEIKASSGKRRKTSPSSISLIDLPNEALSHAASYLARPSRALFAISINDVCDDELSSVILGLSGAQQHREQFDILDFGEIEASLAAKITDGILLMILVSIAASANLKKLKLAGCVNIWGSGLSPLRGSGVLQQIDLSLVAEHKRRSMHPVPRLSCACVLPVLDSIIERNDNVLRSIVFPKSWREFGSYGNTVLDEFMRRCSIMFGSRNITCVKCDESVHAVQESDLNPWFHLDGEFYGVQTFTCYDCMKHFCDECTDEEGGLLLRRCDFCEKEYCRKCVQMEQCTDPNCAGFYCKECKSMRKCGKCKNLYCGDCQTRSLTTCSVCDGEICSDCRYFDTCARCHKTFCNPHCGEFYEICKNCA